MIIDFTHRNVFISGSTSGIGFATAQAFLASGANVVINGRSEASVDAVLQSDVDRTGDSLDKVATDFIAAHRSSSIIKRAARVDEVANMVLYVSSEQASATTGAALRVDGGVIESI